MNSTDHEGPADSEKAFVDFSQQAKYCEEYLKIEEKIFQKLISISNSCKKKESKIGVMMVLGHFCNLNDCKVEGIRQMGINFIKKYISFSLESFSDEISELILKNSDGAFVIDKNGQILGTKMYLEVEHPSLDVPEGCGTRHITAASFSTRKEVESIFTLSEETSIVRIWKDGVVVEQYDPNDSKDSKV